MLDQRDRPLGTFSRIVVGVSDFSSCPPALEIRIFYPEMSDTDAADNPQLALRLATAMMPDLVFELRKASRVIDELIRLSANGCSDIDADLGPTLRRAAEAFEQTHAEP